MLIGSSLQLHFFLMLQHEIKELQNYPFPTRGIQIHASTQTSVHVHAVFLFLSRCCFISSKETFISTLVLFFCVFPKRFISAQVCMSSILSQQEKYGRSHSSRIVWQMHVHFVVDQMHRELNQIWAYSLSYSYTLPPNRFCLFKASESPRICHQLGLNTQNVSHKEAFLIQVVTSFLFY